MRPSTSGLTNQSPPPHLLLSENGETSQLSLVPNIPEAVLLPSSPTSPSRKVVRVQSPVKDDGPAIDVEILEREYFPPIFKELVVQSGTSSQREKKILVPVDLHPALAEAYLVRNVYRLMEEQKKEIWTEMGKVVEEQREIGFNDALRMVLAGCTIPIRGVADDLGVDLSPVSKRFITGLMTIDRPQTPVPSIWTPPPYENVDEYVLQICRESINVVIGNL